MKNNRRKSRNRCFCSTSYSHLLRVFKEKIPTNIIISRANKTCRLFHLYHLNAISVIDCDQMLRLYIYIYIYIYIYNIYAANLQGNTHAEGFLE